MKLYTGTCFLALALSVFASLCSATPYIVNESGVTDGTRVRIKSLSAASGSKWLTRLSDDKLGRNAHGDVFEIKSSNGRIAFYHVSTGKYMCRDNGYGKMKSVTFNNLDKNCRWDVNQSGSHNHNFVLKGKNSCLDFEPSGGHKMKDCNHQDNRWEFHTQLCDTHQTRCGGDSDLTCEDLVHDEHNCGSCGNVCGSGETCCGSSCRASSYFADNNAHCGRCDNVCHLPNRDCMNRGGWDCYWPGRALRGSEGTDEEQTAAL